MNEFESLKKIFIVPDGRKSLFDLYSKFAFFSHTYGFLQEEIYSIPIDENKSNTTVPIYCFISPRCKPHQSSLAIMTGIHGEEPAGPNAFFNQTDFLGELGQTTPLVIFPMMNPAGYYRNWRFHDMECSLDRRNVTDARHLLSATQYPDKRILDRPITPIADIVTQYFLSLIEKFPIKLFIDFHEDEKLFEGYIYSQGALANNDPIAKECVRILKEAGMKMMMEGKTRFPGEIITNGMVTDEKGNAVLDGSIDHLASAKGAKTSLVIETPTKGDLLLEQRIVIHESILKQLGTLWQMTYTV